MQAWQRSGQEDDSVRSGPTGSPDSDWHLPQRAHTVSWRSVDSEQSFTNPLSAFSPTLCWDRHPVSSDFATHIHMQYKF